MGITINPSLILFHGTTEIIEDPDVCNIFKELFGFWQLRKIDLDM